MRKNKMMRTAAVLGVATMLTASVLSGTFAKYTTTATGGDSARVAKWGITMGNNGKSTFSDTYTGPGSGNTVVASDNKDVVAPGTHGSATYKVSGAPETAYEITFKGEATNDVFLKSGLKYDYAVSTDAANDIKDATYASTQSGTVNADYYPVNYSVKITSSAKVEDKKPTLSAADGENNNYLKLDTPSTFETLAAAMEALNNTVATYNTPNTEAGLTVEFKWAWAFDTEDTTGDNVITVNGGHKANDVYDTVLGDLTTETKNANLTITPVTGEDSDKSYNTEIGYTLSMTATQID